MESRGVRKNPTLICAPIMGDSIDKMVDGMAKAKASTADLVEIRLDSLKSFNPYEDLKVLIKECPLPTLFTYRLQDWIFFLLNLQLNCFSRKQLLMGVFSFLSFVGFPLYPC